MNNKQIKWASQHDWFIKANSVGVLVKDFVIVDGAYEERVIQMDDFQELKEWAGY